MQAVGNLASACIVGPAISRAGPRAVIYGMGALPLTVAGAAWLMHEPRNYGLAHTLSDTEELCQLDQVSSGGQPSCWLLQADIIVPSGRILVRKSCHVFAARAHTVLDSGVHSAAWCAPLWYACSPGHCRAQPAGPPASCVPAHAGSAILALHAG